MFFTESLDNDFGETLIDNLFIDIFMPMANGTHVKVYLLGYRYSKMPENKKEDSSNETLAKNLSLPLADVLDAWKYWEKQKLVRLHPNSSDPLDFSVEFLNLKKLYMQNIFIPKSPLEKALEDKKDNKIKEMQLTIENLISRTLNPNEILDLFNLMEKFHYDSSMIIRAYLFAKESNRSKSVSSIEAILRTWYDNKVNNLAELEIFLEKRSNRFLSYNKIFTSLGFYRMPSVEEKNIMDMWIDIWSFPMDSILYACSKSKNTSNPSIAFINGVLNRWNNANVLELESIQQWEKNSKIPKIQKSNNPKDAEKFKTKFHNFKQETSNYSAKELEDKLIQKQKKDLNTLFKKEDS